MNRSMRPCLILLGITACAAHGDVSEAGPRDRSPKSGSIQELASGPVEVDPATLTRDQQRAFAGWVFMGVEMRLVEIVGPPGRRAVQLEVINHTYADLTLDADGTGKAIYQFVMQKRGGDEPERTLIGTALPGRTVMPHQSTSVISLPLASTYKVPEGCYRIVVLVRRTDDLDDWWSLPSIWMNCDRVPDGP